jgi:hypothetical protein
VSGAAADDGERIRALPSSAMKKHRIKPQRAVPPVRAQVPDLTCFVHEGWAPRIVPASAKKAWMDATPESYAYRCLPLQIANAHGWEVLSPCGFKARWTGGVNADAVEIVLDEGADPAHAPTSLFGSGTITFHVEGIMRTSKGWNLWVGGPPNGMKDAIAPLAGLIETDWSPYTFTMNWRFTRAGEWVRFEENEPFCHFFPVPRGVAAVKPKLKPMEDNPALLAGYRGWSEARAKFQQWVRENQPKKNTDQWQKLYYRGLDPLGNEGTSEHESKLRLQAFEQVGSRMVCPVTHGAAADAPQADAS